MSLETKKSNIVADITLKYDLDTDGIDAVIEAYERGSFESAKAISEVIKGMSDELQEIVNSEQEKYEPGKTHDHDIQKDFTN